MKIIKYQSTVHKLHRCFAEVSVISRDFDSRWFFLAWDCIIINYFKDQLFIVLWLINPPLVIITCCLPYSQSVSPLDRAASLFILVQSYCMRSLPDYPSVPPSNQYSCRNPINNSIVTSIDNPPLLQGWSRLEWSIEFQRQGIDDGWTESDVNGDYAVSWRLGGGDYGSYGISTGLR